MKTNSEKDQPEQAAVPTAKNKKSKSSWRYGFKVDVRNEADMGYAEMSVCGPIGYSYFDDSGTSAKQFRDALATIPKNRNVKVRINSEGGSIQDGLEMYNLLKERAENVTCVIDGYALSCASLIALAGDTVISPQSSIWMIHTPRSSTYGDAAEHEASIEMLKTHQDMMADVYSSELGITKDEANAIMEAETWYTGAEAVAVGLADALDEDDLDQEDDEGQDDTIDARRLVNVVAMHRYTPPDHIRKLISASAKTGSEKNKPAGSAASTTEKESMEKPTTTPVAAATTASLEERFNQERRARISGEVNRRATGKIKNDQLDWWIEQATATQTAEAEQAVYAQIDAMPVAAAPGAPAIRPDKPEVDAGRKPIFEVPVAHGAVRGQPKRLD